MKRGFTMVELIITIVIMGILSAGAYISLTKLFTRSAQSKAISDLSFESVLISHQIGALLAQRVPSTVIGYDPTQNKFESVYALSDKYPVLEWIANDNEGLQSGMFSGFIDLDRSDKENNMLYSPNTDINATNRAVIFAGAFDEGDITYDQTVFQNAFGWHEHNSSKIFELNTSSSTHENLYLTTKPAVVYEKYTLVKSAFAIARYEDIEQNASCIQTLGLDNTIGNNTLFLFYNYRPWRGETFCADPNGSDQNGSVTILSTETGAFSADFVNDNLQFTLTLERTIKKPGKDFNVTISKRKVIY